MCNKIVAFFTAVIILLTGCSLKQTSGKEQNITVKEERIESLSSPEKSMDPQTINNTEYEAGISYNINKEFKQGEVTTTVREISLYPDTQGPGGYNVIKFNISVKNSTGKDIYMVYDISPLVLNTGEQIDFASKCDIHRVFKDVVKDGVLTYKTKSKIEDIKTLRWVIASPMYNGTQLIGKEWDFIFMLDKYEKGNLRKAK